VVNQAWCTTTITIDPNISQKALALGQLCTNTSECSIDPKALAVDAFVKPTGAVLGDDYYTYSQAL